MQDVFFIITNYFEIKVKREEFAVEFFKNFIKSEAFREWLENCERKVKKHPPPEVLESAKLLGKFMP